MADPQRFALKHHHGALSVPDMEASIAWYGRVLGFEVERRFPIPHIPAQVAILRRDDLRIELFQVQNGKPLPEERRQPDQDVFTHGNKHVAFAIEDVAAAAAELRRHGVDVVFVMEAEFGSNIFIRDNAGNLLEFVQQPDMWASQEGRS